MRLVMFEYFQYATLFYFQIWLNCNLFTSFPTFIILSFVIALIFVAPTAQRTIGFAKRCLADLPIFLGFKFVKNPSPRFRIREKSSLILTKIFMPESISFFLYLLLRLPEYV